MTTTTIPPDLDVSIPVGLDRCEDEQIRIPGSIQTHGFFLLLHSTINRVLAASENAELFLHIPMKLILGAALETLVDREPFAAWQAFIASKELNNLPTYLGAFRIKDELCSMVTHSLEAGRVVEFERLDRLVSPELMNAVVTNFVSRLSGVDSEKNLCHAIVSQIKDLTSFDRVLLYSFDNAGNGTVLCEENNGLLSNYEGLRFPASDIPSQARELYLLNTTRCIPDARYVPSSLIGLVDVNAKRLDLSLSVLRSVSPLHLEYMQNMGTAASLSISIVCEGRLWGLISAHNSTPKGVPYLIRSACDLLTKVVATQLSALRTASELKTRIQFHTVHRGILTRLAGEADYFSALESQVSELTNVTDADGAATLIDGRLSHSGSTPGSEDILRIIEWLNETKDMELFVSRHLGEDFPPAIQFKSTCSGLIALRVSEINRGYILWFRPEIVRTVNWAGKPRNSVDQASRLHPRLSFETWAETVIGNSAAWSEMAIESAREFRTDILKIILKRAEEAEHVSEARFKQLTQAIPSLVWTSDDEGKLTFANERWAQLGLPATGNWMDAEQLSAEDAERCHVSWEAAALSGKPFEEEVRLRLNDNAAERWNLVRAIPFQRVDGSRAGWVGTFTDLTDRRERELAIRMTEKLALTGRMTSVIAHEINNPLEAITNLLYLLRSRVAQDQEAKEYLSLAELELDRISGITKQTLRWSKESIQVAESKPARILFEDVLRLFAGKIRNRAVSVALQGGGDIEVFGVVGQLIQVVANLFSNALDASPVNGTISLEARSSGCDVELAVRDSGCGMSEETQSQIFTPFFSTKGDLGNGLGLYISHEIVERHKGTIAVDSVLGRGTKITIRLPGQPLAGCRQNTST